MPIEDAAVAMGIPMEEVFEHAQKAIEKPELIAYSLKLVAEDSLKTALEHLRSVIKEGVRIDPDGGLHHTDVDAAKFLAKLAMDAVKYSFPKPAATLTLGKGPKGGMIQFDLWDGPGPWDLKKPGS
jgi:hypothetical protein